ncbi:hypothetical protein [Peribacillus asahii]|uniref:hypothetical protein n=1 Tax=Peribacillus asahii TaxID=228899 RepID=UPI003804E4F9
MKKKRTALLLGLLIVVILVEAVLLVEVLNSHNSGPFITAMVVLPVAIVLGGLIIFLKR